MPSSVIRGTAAVVGAFVSADVVLPARHSFLSPEDMARHVLAELEPAANERVRSHTILVAGEAFGYGTGRESPARALRAAGIRAVVGGPFARMFFRNAINNGVLVVDCEPLARAGVEQGTEIEIDLDHGTIRCSGATYSVPPVPRIVREIIEAGSLIDYGRAVVAARQERHGRG